MFVNLSQVVTHGVDNIFVEALELCGCVERADVEGEFLRSVQKELDTA
jgi:hypothetical protein